MSKTLRVPDPVYEAIEREARRRDVARGVIVMEWMQTAQRVDGEEGGGDS